jgi:hypothetical protein
MQDTYGHKTNEEISEELQIMDENGLSIIKNEQYIYSEVSM